MKNLIKSTALAAGFALAALGMVAAPASAATVTATSASVTTADSGFSWTVNFICSAALPCNGGNPVDTLAGSAVFTLSSVVTSATTVQWGINLVLSNTSAAGVAGFLTAMGFATDPNATMGTVSDSNADGIVFAGGGGSIPGFGNTELCVWDGQNCAASNEHAMTAGVSDTMNFVLTTGLSGALSFTDFAVKFAGAGPDGGSYEFGGTIGGGGPAPVPLPAAGGLLLAGLGGLVALRRKQKAA